MDSDRPPAAIELGTPSGDVRRGGRVRVRGSVAADGEACPSARVDIAFRSREGHSFVLGSLPTDSEGRFDAELTVPLELDVGDYSLAATTPGAGACGASR